MKVIEEIRRERLKELRKVYGTFAAINIKLGRLPKDATLTQLANESKGSKTNKPKGMGSAQARQIEEKLDKPRGWMDNDPDLWPLPAVDPEDYRKLKATERRFVEDAAMGAIRALKSWQTIKLVHEPPEAQMETDNMPLLSLWPWHVNMLSAKKR